MYVLDSSSTKVAGNDCTEVIHKLLDDSASKAKFLDFVATQPFRADVYKEKFSLYYSDDENSNLMFNCNVPNIGTLRSADFGQFASTVDEMWSRINSDISAQLRRANVPEEDLKFVIVSGGGALHSGLRYHLHRSFHHKVITSREPQFRVAQGAVLFALDAIFPGREDRPNGRDGEVGVWHVIDKRVWVEFPEATGQKPVEILSKGQQVSLKRPVQASKALILDSNYFFPEGEAKLCIGGLTKSMGTLDIPWTTSKGERADHPGKLSWTFDAAKGTLQVALKLDNVKVNHTNDQFLCLIEQILTVPGRFNNK
jgi:hypothetical protein